MGTKITLSMGLVSFGASLDKATETAIETRNLCVGSNGKPAHDPTLLRAPRACDTCGEITDYAGIVKGVKQGSTYAIVTQEEVAEAKIKNDALYKAKVTLVPHPRADFDAHTAAGKNLYFITPQAGAEDHYALLTQLVSSHQEFAFASLYTPRSRAGLYSVNVRSGVLVLEERTRGQAIKAAPQVGGSVNDQLYAAMEGMLPIVQQPYDPDAYEDGYTRALEVMAAAAGQTVSLGKDETVTAPTPIKNDSDLIAQINAAVELAKSA